MTPKVCPIESSVYLESQIVELPFRNSEKNETPCNKVHLNNIQFFLNEVGAAR